MQIFVRDSSSNKYTLQVEPSTTIKSVREMVSARKGCKTSSIALIYEGRPMDEEKTLADHKVEPLASIHMVLRLIGGISLAN